MSEAAGVRMDVVAEAPLLGEWTPPWPVAAIAPFEWIVLDGGASPETIGSVVALLAQYNRHRAPEGTADGSATEVLRAIVATESPILPGGVRVRDGAGNAVVPGCCCDVVTWREWLRVTDGETSPWMGHDPWGWVEHTPSVVRVWSDEKAKPADVVVIPRAELPRLLAGLRADLEAFAARLHAWAMEIDPDLAGPLAERFRTAFVRV